MQVAGGLGATGVVGSGTAAAQQSTDNVIQLEAIRQGGLDFDVDDDGTVSYADVITFFEGIDDPAIRNDPESYDFNRNGRVDFDDVVTLFEQVDDPPTDGSGEHVWRGVSPDDISDQINPTLALTPGETYTVEWTNTAGGENDFVIADADGNEIVSSDTVSEQGATGSVEFMATEAMATYYSSAHSNTQRGSIDVGSAEPPEPSDDMISVLWLGGPAGGSHNPPTLAPQLVEYLLNRGIEVVYTDRLEDLLPDTLHRYDAFMMYGNRFGLTEAMENSIVEFIEGGGGFIPLHSASGSFPESDVWIDLVGGQFDFHNAGEMTTNRIKPDHPVFTGNDPVVSWDETYRNKNHNPDNVVLAHGDFPEGDYGSNEDPEPWIWVRQEGDGRVFYTAWGHDERTWSKENFKKLIENAIRWTTGNEDTIAADSRVLDELEFMDAEDTIPFFGPADEVPSEVGSGQNWEKMQVPLPTEKSLKRTITPEGFDLETFVSEDMLPDGVGGNIFDIEFDAQGRAWIALTKDYPNSLGEGNQDKIVICEDTDGDGVADEFTVFKDGLSIPVSMALIENGVIVAHLNENDGNGQMLRLEDTDGDGVADSEEVLFSGFGTFDTHAGPNQLDYGIDNWIWGQVGYAGFSGTVAGEQREFSSCVYRFKPDGSQLEVVRNLPGNQAGLDFDEEGLVFASCATSGQPSNYVPIPQRYYELVNGFQAPSLGPISDSNRILPMTDRVRQGDQHGGFTAATGHTMYTARQYPEKYWNRTAFVSEPTGHLLSTFYVQPDGADFTAHYPYNMAASTDAWFSPIFQSMGPDGQLWFVDHYNYVILHNTPGGGPPLGEGNAYVSTVRDHMKARVYRATYGDTSSSGSMDLSGASPSDLVSALSNDNMFWRLTAQRKLVERGETDVVSGLVALVGDESVDDIGLDPGSIHALWTLKGLGALDEGGDSSALQAARDALTHSSAGVRLNAARVLPGTEATRSAILDNGLLNDDNARVRMWALLALAETPASDAAGEAVYQMISQEKNYSDDVLINAATSAGATHASGFIAAYEANEDTNGGDDPLPNLLSNPSFETGTGESGGSTTPRAWRTRTWGGNAEFSWATTARNGGRSVKIASSEGVDANWVQTASVEPNTDYTYSAYVKTENLDKGDGYGAFINVQELGQDSISDTVIESGTNDWTKLETSFNSGDNDQLEFNVSLGGWGQSTGTVWFDDASAVDPDGNEVLTNGGFELAPASKPEGWTSTEYSGNAEFSWPSTGHSGNHSVQIASSGGADASWGLSNTVSVDPNTEYTLSGWIKTENLQKVDGSGIVDGNDQDPLGAGFNVDELGFVPDQIATAPTGTNDWTEVSATVNTGDNSEVTVNAFLGGFGQASGTVWYDDVRLENTDGENLLSDANAGFETGAGGSATMPETPEGWTTNTYNGSGEFDYVSGTARTGTDSVKTTSTSGLDGGWSQVLSVEPNATYQYSVWVKTENLDVGDSHGAVVNLHGIGGEGAAGQLNQGGTMDWTKIQGTITVGDVSEVQFNVGMGGWGTATGTIWYDDAKLVKTGAGGSAETVYNRVVQHQELENGDDNGGDGSTAIDPSTTIKFDGEVGAWIGQAPSSIADQSNPTLTLQEGATYTVEWESIDGAPHDFDVRDSEDNTLVNTDVVSGEGATGTVEITVTAEMAQYICSVHPSMVGDIEVVSSQ